MSGTTKCMATKKKAAPETEEGGGVLETAAKAVGSALGTIAKTAGLAKPAGKSEKHPGRLVAKNKKRLPRKEKKRLLKDAGKNSAA